MNDKDARLREKIAQLKAAFLAELPARIALARQVFARLTADAGDRTAMVEFHRILHGIKGTGHSFGFVEAGDAAAKGEALAAQALAGAGGVAADDRRLAACLDELDRVIAGLQADAVGADDPSAFPVSAAADGSEGDGPVGRHATILPRV